jgi:outer membrane protein
MFSYRWVVFSCGLLASGFVQANTLVDIYSIAKDEDQTFQAALHQRDAALLLEPQAYTYLLPQVTGQLNGQRDRLHVLSSQQSVDNSLNGTGSTAGTPAPAVGSLLEYYSSRGYSINLSQALFDWSAFQTLSQSHKQVAQAEAAYRSAEQSLIYRVSQAYFAVLTAADVLRADKGAEAAFKRQLDQATLEFNVGYVAVTDVRNAQAAYDNAESVLIQDQQNLDSARRAVEEIVNRPVNHLPSLQDEIPLAPPTPLSEESWTKAAIQDNPDIMAAWYASEAARKQIDVYVGKYLPTISAVGTVGHQYSNSSFGDDYVSEAVGLTLNWNFLQGGLTTTQVLQARATYKQAQAQFELQRRTIVKATRDAYEGVISGISAVNASKQALLSSQTSLEANIVSQKVGSRTEVDVLNAQQALATAQRTYFQSRYNYINSGLLLKQQAGRLTESDLEQIDNLLVKPSNTVTAPISPESKP